MKTESVLEKIFDSGQLAVTSECGPPRGALPEKVTEKAKMLAGYVDGINVTDNQTAMVRMSSLAACILIKQMGLDPILQMVTRDRNRLAMQSDIIGAFSFGINLRYSRARFDFHARFFEDFFHFLRNISIFSRQNSIHIFYNRNFCT